MNPIPEHTAEPDRVRKLFLLALGPQVLAHELEHALG